MCTKIILIFVIAVSFTATEAIHRGDYIPITEAPYFVSLIATEQRLPYCGGAIISEYWILTAAHCMQIIETLPSAVPIKVRAGSTTETSEGDIHEVEKVVVYGGHERYYSLNLGNNDIALLKLKNPIAFNEYKQPIKVSSRLPDKLGEVTVVGIGLENMRLSRSSAGLKKATLFYDNWYSKIYKKKMPSIFGLGTFSHSAEMCAGDSGSPAIVNREVIGIYSSGPPCANWVLGKSKTPIFQAYTQVDMFYDWIMDITGIKY